MKNKILLLSCCAPCSCSVIEKMAKDKKDFAVIFYNPNIKPFEEYQKRLEENKLLCKIYNVAFIEMQYDCELWDSLTKNLMDEPERGNRCSVCFYMRLKKTFQYAKENGFDAVGSVLGVSRYKDIEQVNKVAQKVSQQFGIPYIHIEARKDGMQKRANELVKEHELYHQDYCGCKPR